MTENGSATDSKELNEFNDCLSTRAYLHGYSADLMRGLCGLQNLGNTCFMNSAIQCLSNVPELTKYFLEDKYVDEINTVNPLGTGGRLVKQYADLLKDMWSGQCASVRPYELKQIIGQIAPRFTGHAQHDSQELTAFLLDGLHEDLNRIKQKPYVEEKELSGQDESQAAKQSWEDYRKRNDSIIVDLLHGQHKSTLTCNVCNKISIKFEPFCFLSVPVPTKEFKSHSTLVFLRAEKWAKFHITHTSKTTAGQLKQTLREQLPLPSNTQMLIYASYSGRILKDDCTLTSANSYNNYYAFSPKFYAYAIEPGPVLLVENVFAATTPLLFLPRPSKLTRRAVLTELVPLVRDLCLSSSSSSGWSSSAGTSATTVAASATAACSSSALVPYTGGTPFGGTAFSSTASSSMFSSPTSSLSMSSSSTTITGTMAPVVSSSSSSSAAAVPSSPYLSSLTTLSPQQLALNAATSVGRGGTPGNPRRTPSSRLSGGEAAAGASAAGGSSPAMGDGAPVEAMAAADLPSSSSVSSPPWTAGRIVVTSANGGDALDDVVPSPLSPSSVANSEPATDDANSQQQHHADDEPDTMMDTTENDEEEGVEESPAVELPTPIGIEMKVKGEKMAFPQDMDEEIAVHLTDNITEDGAIDEQAASASSPTILKLYWDKKLRTRFDNSELNQLVDREVHMMAPTLKKCYTLKECIDMYTQQEQLNEEDSWYCPNCKTHRRAFKKLDLWTLPQILIIHLKRFSYGRYTRDKIETELEFPIRGLDLGDKVLNPEHSQEKYDLVGISNHSGGLGSGHYTACALNGTEWCEFNDSSAFRLNREVPDVFTSREAYMLFYRRREEQPQPLQHREEEEEHQQQ